MIRILGGKEVIINWVVCVFCQKRFKTEKGWLKHLKLHKKEYQSEASYLKAYALKWNKERKGRNE